LPDLRAALREGLARCRPGDTLVYACATDLADLEAAFGGLQIEEDRVAPGHMLRLAWSSPVRARGAATDEIPLSLMAGGARRAMRPRLQDPA
jgi:hypothetical protein